MLRLVLTVVVGLGATSSTAQTPYGACPERAQHYQELYESGGQMKDMVCMQKAMERDVLDSSSYDCPASAQSYQTAYETAGRFDDMICMQKALTRELQ